MLKSNIIYRHHNCDSFYLMYNLDMSYTTIVVKSKSPYGISKNIKRSNMIGHSYQVHKKFPYIQKGSNNHGHFWSDLSNSKYSFAIYNFQYDLLFIDIL